MGGDFLAFQIHRDPKFFPITNDLLIEGVKITNQNMWRFPNLLSPIGLEAKVYPRNRPWVIDNNLLKILEDTYGDKQILLPAHWYNQINPEQTNGLFNQAVRLYAKDKKTLKICYALWWIKSHAIANEIWPHRAEEIDEYIKSNQPYKHLIPEILKSYHNWKFIAIKYNILNNGILDIDYYIRHHFYKLYSKENTISHTTGYTFYDVDHLFYNGMENIDLISEQFDVNINKNEVTDYSNKNLELLHECLGFSIKDSKFDDDEIYFNAIINYAKDIINERPNQFDYYNRKRIS